MITLIERLRNFFPITDWLSHYQQRDFIADFSAGIIVAVVLVPQSMAYAMLAGLPPQMGLYSSVLPLILYGLLGSSRALAVGPVGLVSLMTGTAIADLGLDNTAQIMTAATIIAAISGLVLLSIRIFHLSSVTKFFSHPVMSGFTSAAAILIAMSQVKHLLGIELESVGSPFSFIEALYDQAHTVNPITAFFGLGSIFILLTTKNHLAAWLKRWGVKSELPGKILSKTGPFLVVLLSVITTWLFDFHYRYQLDIVGDIPSGMPQLALPSFDWGIWQQLFSIAALMSVIGFFESVSVAKALASRKRQRIDADQECLALGIANIGASCSGGMPVAGGFARSFVNFSAGAITPMAGIMTAMIVLFGLLFLTDVIYYLPRCVLAAIIMVAISQLIDFNAIKEAWIYSKSDASAIVITFLGVLTFGIESGILSGVLFSIGQYLHRSSRPHIAVVGRVGNTEHYRNIERHQVVTHDNILAIRVDESLYFANTNYLEENIINLVADNPDVSDVVIICSAVNFIDTSALHSLETLAHLLQTVDIKLHFAAVKGPIMDRLLKSDFLEKICTGRVYFSTHAAVTDISKKYGQNKSNVYTSEI